MRASYCLALVSIWTTFAYGYSSRLLPLRTQQLQRSSSAAVVDTNKLLSQPSTTSTIGTRTMSLNTIARGGGASAQQPKCPVTGPATVLSSVWGAGGVVYILARAIARVWPIAIEPFQAGAVPLTQVQLSLYIATCLWFAYVEGYKGFQTKFSPLVVKRAFTLVPGKNGTQWYHFLLAPLYSMGMMHATRQRKLTSWAVTMGVAGIVAAVKRLPYPWRNIVDAGVVAGLTWGSLSILLLYVKSWMTGTAPMNVDAALPDVVVNTKTL